MNVEVDMKMKECRIEIYIILMKQLQKNIFYECIYAGKILPKIEEFLIKVAKILYKEEYEEKEN